MKPLTFDIAWKIANETAEARRVSIVKPDSPARAAFVLALSAEHALTGSGWDLERARSSVSVTLPAVGPVLTTLVGLIPSIGGILSRVAAQQDRTTVYLSPNAVATPKSVLSVVSHELGHADQIALGGLMWCLAYGLVPQIRATEGSCYGQDIAVDYNLGLGGNEARLDLIDRLARGAAGSLQAYGLDSDAMALALSQLAVARRTLQNGGELGGPSHDILEALRAEGCL
jgi:hypothetical protein